jgi:hypothetical protein
MRNWVRHTVAGALLGIALGLGIVGLLMDDLPVLTRGNAIHLHGLRAVLYFLAIFFVGASLIMRDLPELMPEKWQRHSKRIANILLATGGLFFFASIFNVGCHEPCR